MEVLIREVRPDDAEAIIGTAQRQARINGKYVDEIIIERFL